MDIRKILEDDSIDNTDLPLVGPSEDSTRVIVILSGGIVSDVYSSDPTIKFDLIDDDFEGLTQEEEAMYKENLEALRSEFAGLNKINY